MYITQPVDRVNGHNHLSQVELSHVLRDTVSKLTEQSQQVPTHVVIHHQVLQYNTGTHITTIVIIIIIMYCSIVSKYMFTLHKRNSISKRTASPSMSSTNQVVVVLKGVVQCGDPLTVSFDQDVAFFSETCRLYRSHVYVTYNTHVHIRIHIRQTRTVTRTGTDPGSGSKLTSALFNISHLFSIFMA